MWGKMGELENNQILETHEVRDDRTSWCIEDEL